MKYEIKIFSLIMDKYIYNIIYYMSFNFTPTFLLLNEI